ncbi:MAG TPA: hypothetical protein ENN63_02065 [Bacteroidetes bacterium]|nr:hypothetical protein [Bacteroidota bacterium]
MLEHVALAVNDSEEIENFFEEVLMFRLEKKFILPGEVTRQVFDVESNTDVYLMKRRGITLEIFITGEKEKKVFSHLCLAYPDPQHVYERAAGKGYATILREKGEHTTYFIRDKSHNMFEIKKAG